MKTRTIEMYVGEAYGGDSGSWSTDYVDIPIDTPEDKIHEVASKILLDQLTVTAHRIAFVGIYNIPEIEEDDLDQLYEVLGYSSLTDFEERKYAVVGEYLTKDKAVTIAEEEQDGYHMYKVQSYDREDIELYLDGKKD